MKDEYIIINKTAIQKRIEKIDIQKKDILKIRKELYSKYGHTINYFNSIESWNSTYSQLVIESKSLKQILSQSTPLIPEIEKAYEAGKLDEELSKTFDNPKGRYISNLKLDI